MSQLVELSIERLAAGGAGIGRLADGMVCFVHGTAPGERITARLRRRGRHYAEAELAEILSPAPERCPPPCPIAGECGGCSWQHLTYAAQLSAKQEIVAGLLQRIGGIDPTVVAPVIPAPEPLGYRARIQLKVRAPGGKPLVGFFAAGSQRVVPLSGTCPIAAVTLNAQLPDLLAALAGCAEVKRIPQVDLVGSDTGEVFAVVHYIGEQKRRIAEQVRHWLPTAAGVLLQTGRKSSVQLLRGEDAAAYHLPAGLFPGAPAVTLRYHATGFAQVNYQQNRSLVSLAGKLLAPTGRERLLELYAGSGNFTLPLANCVHQVIAVEEYQPAVVSAQQNAQYNGISGITWHNAPAEEVVEELATRGERIDQVVLDPPRAGAMAVVKLLSRLSPRRIVYISCDPATLARDAGQLVRDGYRVSSVQPVDLFPQTPHIESVMLLEST